MDKVQDIQFSVIDTVQKYSIPEYSETTYGDKSIVSYGKDNDMPILLRNCYRGSATLKSVIDGYIPYILGSDIVLNEKIATFKEKVNRNGLTMRQFLSTLALDYMIFGGFCFQIIRNKLGVISELYPLNFMKARTNESGTKIFYSKKLWSRYGTKSEEFSRFDPNIVQPTAIFYFKGDYTHNVYPLPTWYGALYDVLTEIECSKYSLNSVSNGFSAKYIVNLPNSGNLPKEQKELIEARIKEKFTGSETDSNFMLYYANSDNPLTVSKVESDDTTERFIAIKDNCRSNIYTALRATPLLFGLPNASNGFSTQEYSDSFKLFNNTVIRPIQEMLTESLSQVFKIALNGENAMEIKEFKIVFENE